jgi:hypothetical protein
MRKVPPETSLTLFLSGAGTGKLIDTSKARTCPNTYFTAYAASLFLRTIIFVTGNTFKFRDRDW